MFDTSWTIYQMFPRYYGSFQAMTEDLERLKNLGVDVLYLMPFHPTGEKDRKGAYGSPYAIKDYFAIDPMLGGERDLALFISEAHRHGFRVLYDAVLHHTATDSVIVRDYPEWIKKDEEGNFTREIDDLDDIYDYDFEVGDLWYYLADVLAYWKNFGFDGFRADVAGLIRTDFWTFVKDQVDPEGNLIWLSESPQYELCQVFDAIYNYELYKTMYGIWTGTSSYKDMYSKVWMMNDIYSERCVLVNFLENHDWPRAAAMIKGEEVLLHWTVFMYFLPGVPMISQGQEYAETEKIDIFSSYGTWSIEDRDMRWFRVFQGLNKLRHSLGVWQEGDAVPMRVAEDTPEGIFALLRYTEDGEYLLGLFNLSGADVSSVAVELGTQWDSGDTKVRDILSGKDIDIKGLGDGYVEIPIDSPKLLYLPTL